MFELIPHIFHLIFTLFFTLRNVEQLKSGLANVV
jgi:hypothetical protein